MIYIWQRGFEMRRSDMKTNKRIRDVVRIAYWIVHKIRSKQLRCYVVYNNSLYVHARNQESTGRQKEA